MSRARFIGEGVARRAGGFCPRVPDPGSLLLARCRAEAAAATPHLEGPRAADGGSGCAVAGLVLALHPVLIASCDKLPHPGLLPVPQACHSLSGLLQSLGLVPAPLLGLVTSRPTPSARACCLLRSVSVSRAEVRRPWSPREASGNVCALSGTGAAVPRLPRSSGGSAAPRSLSYVGALVVVVSDCMDLAWMKMLVFLGN